MLTLAVAGCSGPKGNKGDRAIRARTERRARQHRPALRDHPARTAGHRHEGTDSTVRSHIELGGKISPYTILKLVQSAPLRQSATG
jgi:hypothetical protein